jgi:hypothetical protein
MNVVLWILNTRQSNLTDNFCTSCFLWGGAYAPLGHFFRSPRFRFLRSLCSSPLGPCKSQHCGHIGLLCIPRMIHEGDCGVIGAANDDCRGNRRTRRKPSPAPLCPTTNPTWPVRFRTPDRSCGKPATNRLSYGAANPCLMADLVGPDTEHLASPFNSHRNDIVASETSVMLAHCVAVDLFSVQLTVAWVPTVERIRYHGYICSTPTLRNNGTVFPAFG